MYVGQVSRNNSSRRCRNAWRPLLVSARLNHCVAFNPSPLTSLIHSFIHPVSRTHVRVTRSPTAFSPCPALSCVHTHTDSRSFSRWLPHARYLAYTHQSSHIVTPHRTLTLHHATVPSHCLTLTFTCLALFRFTLPHSASLPFVWLSHWLSITLCYSHHALLSHTPPSHYLALTITLTRVLSRIVAHWLTIVINPGQPNVPIGTISKMLS